MDKRDAPETQRGPARRLVERMKDATEDVEYYGIDVGATETVRNRYAAAKHAVSTIRAAADQHDAAFAALVQAAQTFVQLEQDGEPGFTDEWAARYEAMRGQMRAALDAVRTEADDG